MSRILPNKHNHAIQSPTNLLSGNPIPANTLVGSIPLSRIVTLDLMTFPYWEILQLKPVLAARTIGVIFSTHRIRASRTCCNLAPSSLPNHPSLLRLMRASALRTPFSQINSRTTLGTVSSKQIGVAKVITPSLPLPLSYLTPFRDPPST